MINTSFKQKQRGLIWLLQLVFACMIVVWLINPISNSIYLFSIFVILWLLATFCLYGFWFFRTYFKNIAILMLPWIIVLLFYHVIGHFEFSMSYLAYLFCLGIGYFYLVVKDTKTCVVVFAVAIAYLFVISIMTLRAYSSFPTISRVLAVGEYEEIVRRGGQEYVSPFIAGYGVIYGLVFLCIGLIRLLQHNNRIIKFVSFFFLCLFSYLIIRSQYFIAIIMLASVYIVTFILGRKSILSKSICIIVVASMILLFFASSSFVLKEIATLPNISGNISIRLNEIADMLSGNNITGSDLLERLKEYNVSLNTFSKYPIFGIGNSDALLESVGDHSTFLDAFAKYGLLGGIPFVMFYAAPIHGIIKKADGKEKKYLVVLTSFFIILALINRANTRPNYALIFIISPMIAGLSSFQTTANTKVTFHRIRNNIIKV